MAKVIIIGGGLSGLSCAAKLIEEGFEVEIYEKESELGGRASNWIEKGKPIESGVHTYFGIYSHLSKLLRKANIDLNSFLKWQYSITFIGKDKKKYVYALNPILAPITFLKGVFGNNSFLSFYDKFTLLKSVIYGLTFFNYYKKHTLREWKKDSNLSENAYENFIRPLVRGLTFAEPEELSARVFFNLLLHMIKNPLNVKAGSFKGGMTDVMINPLAKWLKNKGVKIHTDSEISSLIYSNQDNSINGIKLKNGKIKSADIYVSAIQLEFIQKLLPNKLFTELKSIETVPATSVQILFDKKLIFNDDFHFLARSPFIIFQDESNTFYPSISSYLSGQITDRKTDKFSDKALLYLALKQINLYLPQSKDSQVIKSHIVRHNAILLTPKNYKLRPEAKTKISNLFLAGDYVKQEWYTTMEGAVRGGELAAKEIISKFSPI